MIYSLHLGPLNRYIYTPLTFIHTMDIVYKGSIIFLTVIIIPYQNITKITISMISCACLLIYLRYKSYCNRKKIFFLILGIYVLFYHTTLYRKFFLYIYINIKKSIYIAYLTIRINFIININIIIMQILLLTTIYETIISYIVHSLQLISFKKKKLNYVLTITSFSSQFLDRIFIYLGKKNHGIKIRDPSISFTHYCKFFIIYILHDCIQYVIEEVISITCVCYTREVDLRYFKSYIF